MAKSSSRPISNPCCPTVATQILAGGILEPLSDTPPTEFILLENSDFLLLESGDKIGLE